ncbi:hypothetical protein K1719_014725 [Acacia pycnantha]|nr:hypothetical protein K1719_014725 [Acacia pycnantha]
MASGNFPSQSTSPQSISATISPLTENPNVTTALTHASQESTVTTVLPPHLFSLQPGHTLPPYPYPFVHPFPNFSSFPTTHPLSSHQFLPSSSFSVSNTPPSSSPQKSLHTEVIDFSSLPLADHSDFPRHCSIVASSSLPTSPTAINHPVAAGVSSSCLLPRVDSGSNHSAGISTLAEPPIAVHSVADLSHELSPDRTSSGRTSSGAASTDSDSASASQNLQNLPLSVAPPLTLLRCEGFWLLLKCNFLFANNVYSTKLILLLGAYADEVKPLYLQYANLEEDYGLTKRAMKLYDQATKAVPDNQKLSMNTLLVLLRCLVYPKQGKSICRQLSLVFRTRMPKPFV